MKKRVLLVDDSQAALFALRRLLEDSGSFEVIGEAANGAAALAIAETRAPDLITMDVYLDGQDGVEAARAILERLAARVVLVTGLDPSRADLAFRALAAGALDVLRKPSFSDDEASQHERRRFVAALRALSEVRLLSGKRRAGMSSAPPERATPSRVSAWLALGASTGGPAALQRVLGALPRPFPAPVLIVQHIEAAYVRGFAEWLGETGHQVTLVEEPVLARPAVVYVASARGHLSLDNAGWLSPKAGPPRNFQLPSVDELFESLAEARAKQTFAALLSGMGEDGAVGLVALAKAGGTTVVQSLDSCVVPGMPAAALRRGGARLQLAPEEIAHAAARFVAASRAECEGAFR